MKISQHFTQCKNAKSLRLLCSVFAIIVAGVQSGCISSGDVVMPIPLIPILYLQHSVTHIGEHVANAGEPIGDDHSTIYIEVSDGFGSNELKLFYERLITSEFHSSLTKYTDGAPLPEFKFCVTLCKKTPDSLWSDHSERRVEILFTPHLDRKIDSSTPKLLDGIWDEAKRECKLINSAIQHPDIQSKHTDLNEKK